MAGRVAGRVALVTGASSGLGKRFAKGRLLEAVELAAQLQEPNWASVAADLGYSHQSHFVNDFKKLVGKSPLQYTQTIRTGEGK